MTLQVIFVLVGTTHSGNIGASARAIKTMGFDQLRLVGACSHRTDDALARASGAGDVLDNASTHDSLDAAVADCHVVLGASARQRNISVPLLSCREAIEELGVLQCAASQPPPRVALVFGRERSGLSNDELDRCNRLLHIPSNPAFSSLNLGSAVQVVAYECAQTLRQMSLTNSAPAVPEIPVTSAAMQHFFTHLQRVMINTGFLDTENPRHLMRRVHSYFERNRPTENELNILRGVLSATENPRPPAQLDAEQEI
jgi:TrmH family RNA methyltransferase